ncbi:MAG: sugar ABC transporter permease, partial [Lachnospiraceae bacterium]|nr:sugar ABC transporter permease [Lachnospiraceae bacterium]
GNSVTERNAGIGATVGVMLSVCVVVIFWICNIALKDDDIEF